VTEDALSIEPMRPADVEAVAEMERLSFPTAWQAEAFRSQLGSPGACFLVARHRGRLVGYIGMWVIEEEAHITTLAVHPQSRRRGIGTRLVRAALAEAHRRGAVRATLEVRERNQAARALYEKRGFTAVALLRAYYADTGEDGVVMWLNPIPPPQENEGTMSP
jgi:ribosomal-protein-alanine N-acetyltransferase